jgi:hypothetical protein
MNLNPRLHYGAAFSSTLHSTAYAYVALRVHPHPRSMSSTSKHHNHHAFTHLPTLPIFLISQYSHFSYFRYCRHTTESQTSSCTKSGWGKFVPLSQILAFTSCPYHMHHITGKKVTLISFTSIKIFEANFNHTGFLFFYARSSCWFFFLNLLGGVSRSNHRCQSH